MSYEMRTPAEVFPPGEFIREELEERGWTQDDLARVLGRPLSVLNQIITGKRGITPETALGLAAAFDTSAEFWLNLESAYRLSLAKGQAGVVRERARLYEVAPVKEMERRGWIKEAQSPEGLQAELHRFFGAEPLGTLASMRVAARASIDVGTYAHRAWFQRVWNLARGMHVARFTDSAAEKAACELRALATGPEEAGEVPRVLAAAGIRFLVVEHLPRTRIDGAAVWLDDSAPVIAMSLRYDRIDCFWHTLLHELGHIRHRDASVLDVELAESDQDDRRYDIEARADRSAADLLIPCAELDAYILQTRPHFSKQSIVEFARIQRIHPGIVAGQLQRRGEVQYAAGREMLAKVRDIVGEAALTDGWGRLVKAT